MKALVTGRGILAAAILIVLAATPVIAAPASPMAFVDGIYKHYRNGLDDKWSAYSPPVDAQVFEPGLVNAMREDVKLNAGDEAGWQDVDAFCDCQDETRMKAPVKLISATLTTALVSVDVAQDGEKTSRVIQYKLVMVKDQWRVTDMISPEGQSFRGLVMQDITEVKAAAKKGH